METNNNWVHIGDVGNKPDLNGYGSVPYEYDIARCALSNKEWCDFLNDVGVTRALELGLYHKDMESGVLGGISKGDGINSVFSTKIGYEKKPVTYITYTALARYCNWKMTGNLEEGAYKLGRQSIERLDGATYFIPTNDEWYKAAYWDGEKYWEYPTKSDLPPKLSEANYERGDSLSVGAPYYLADVDDFANCPSPGGALQMGGNVWEFLEDCFKEPLGNMLRGGSFGYTETGLSSKNIDYCKYDCRCYVFGARIAHMPYGWHFVRKPFKIRFLLCIYALKAKLLCLAKRFHF